MTTRSAETSQSKTARVAGEIDRKAKGDKN